MADEIDEIPEWISFQCDGRTFEYLVMRGHEKISPPGWPSHKASPGPLTPIIQVVVRNPVTQDSIGMTLPDDAVVTIEHAIEAARRGWDRLTR